MHWYCARLTPSRNTALGSGSFCNSAFFSPKYPLRQRSESNNIGDWLIQIKKDGKDQESIQSSTTPDPGYQLESDKLLVRHHKRQPRGQDNLQIHFSSASATVLSKGTEPRWKNASWIESLASLNACQYDFLLFPDIELVNISTWKCMEFDQSPGCDITNATLISLISVLILEIWWYMSKTV